MTLELYRFEETLIRICSIAMYFVVFLNFVVLASSFVMYKGKRRIKFIFYNLSNFTALMIFIIMMIDIAYNFKYGIRVQDYSDVRNFLGLLVAAKIVFIEQLPKKTAVERTRVVIAVLKLLVILSLMPFTDEFIPYNVHKVIFYIACLQTIDENIAIAVRMYMYAKNNVTVVNIVQGFVKLDSGILFADEKGRVKLINPYMTRLMEQAGIEKIENISDITRAFESNKEKLGLEPFGKDRVATFASGKSFLVIKDYVTIKNRTYIQLVFSDITKLYKLNKELEDKNRQLEQYNEEITEILANIDNIILDKEAIKIRQQVHDIIGQRLSIVNAATREIEMLGESKAKVEDLNTLIDTLVDDLKKERFGSFDDIFEYLKESFSIVGVDIIINGQIPQSPKLKNNIALILRESITNAIYHADADKVYMDIKNDVDHVIIKIWDNGEIKEMSISEGTGMRGIRNRVENELGGKLDVSIEDRFMIKIDIPLKNA